MGRRVTLTYAQLVAVFGKEGVFKAHDVGVLDGAQHAHLADDGLHLPRRILAFQRRHLRREFPFVLRHGALPRGEVQELAAATESLRRVSDGALAAEPLPTNPSKASFYSASSPT